MKNTILVVFALCILLGAKCAEVKEKPVVGPVASAAVEAAKKVDLVEVEKTPVIEKAPVVAPDVKEQPAKEVKEVVVEASGSDKVSVKSEPIKDEPVKVEQPEAAKVEPGSVKSESGVEKKEAAAQPEVKDAKNTLTSILGASASSSTSVVSSCLLIALSLILMVHIF